MMQSIWRRRAFAVMAATLAATLMGGLTFVEFAPVRIKLLKAPMPAVSGTVGISGADKPALDRLQTPFAVVVTIKNESRERREFRVELDGHTVCQSEVPGNGSRRLDCVMTRGWTPTSAHALTVASTASAWSVDYAELSTHFGVSYGLVHLYVLPAARTVTSAGPLWIVSIWVATFVLLLGGITKPWPLFFRVGHRVIAGLIGLFLIAVWVAPLISTYRVALSTDTILRLVAVLLLPRLVGVAMSVWNHPGVVRVRAMSFATPLMVALLVMAGFGQVMFSRLDRSHEGNYSGFLVVAQDTFDRNPQLNNRPDVRNSLRLQPSGYDAQFMYFAVFDPFIRQYRDTPQEYHAFIDDPPYRFGRIGFSLLTKAVTLDQWRWYPTAMVWLILVALFALSLVLTGIARAGGITPWWGSVVLLVPGFWQSLQSGLPEPLAAALLLGGYWATVRERWLGAGLLLAGSLLIRETGALLVVVLLASVFVSGRYRAACLAGVAALLPIAVWRAYVGLTFFPIRGWRAYFPAPPDLGVPLGGFIDLWQVVARGEYMPDIASAAVFYPVLLIAAFALAVAFVVSRPSALTLATALYATVAISLNYDMIWVHVGNGQRGTYEVFVLLALCSVQLSRPRGMTIAVRAFWALSAAYVFLGAFDADFIREAMFRLL